MQLTKEDKEMNAKAKKAEENHKKGYNCAQAVACAFCQEAGIDEETMFKLTEGHGLGMGGMEGTCGAITGAVAVLGAKNSSGNLQKPNSKANTYQQSRELVQRFKEKNQATVCKDLKGVETGNMLRACSDCVKDAAMLLDDILNRAKK